MKKVTMASSRSVVIAMLFGGVLATQAELPVGTDEEADLYWADFAEMSTRVSTSPRFAEADEAQGEGVLEAFGTQYLPNAYAHYQEVRATAKEREQLLKENFPNFLSACVSGVLVPHGDGVPVPRGGGVPVPCGGGVPAPHGGGVLA